MTALRPSPVHPRLGDSITFRDYAGKDAEISAHISGLSVEAEESAYARAIKQLKGLSPRPCPEAFKISWEFCRVWLRSGAASFRPTASLESSLALTEIPREPVPTPFRAFSVAFNPEVSGGLVGCRVLRPDLLTWSRLRYIFPTSESAGPFDVLCIDYQFRNLHSWMAVPIFSDLTSTGLVSLQPWNCGIPPDVEAYLLRVVFNLCHFVAAKVEPLESDNQRAFERATRYNKPLPARVFTVGRTVKLSPKIRALADLRDGSPLWKLEHRYMVRGHFRWQPIGERLPDGHEGPRNAKRIWIEPHWKGPEGAEAWQHIYEVTA